MQSQAEGKNGSTNGSSNQQELTNSDNTGGKSRPTSATRPTYNLNYMSDFGKIEPKDRFKRKSPKKEASPEKPKVQTMIREVQVDFECLHCADTKAA